MIHDHPVVHVVREERGAFALVPEGRPGAAIRVDPTDGSDFRV